MGFAHNLRLAARMLRRDWRAGELTILGLALGTVSGHRVGNAALSGAVLGGAGGALIGGSAASDDRENELTVYHDVNDKKLEGKVVPSGALASGFIFFPGEARSAKAVRLQIRFRANSEVYTMVLPFIPGEKPQVIKPAPITVKQADG